MASDMKDKKRKASAIEPAAKKSKKNKTIAPLVSDTTSSGATPVGTPDIVKRVQSKEKSLKAAAPAPRKRAADFYSDPEDEGKRVTKASKAVAPAADPVEEQPKKKTAKKTVKVVANGAGDVTAVSEEAEETGGLKKKTKKTQKFKIAGNELVKPVQEAVEETVVEEAKPSKRQKKTKRQPEPEPESEVDRDADVELNVGSDDEADDQAAALLAGFDDDEPDTAEDKELDQNTSMPELNKKAKKKLSKLDKKSANDSPGTVYIGRIPHGFYEHQMRAYFSQFGDITNLRLSRNRKTGASKHFAFIEFDSSEVAKIVAETMDNYLMFGHILKCKYVPTDRLHPDTWKGANRRYKATPWNKLEGKKMAEPKTKEQWEKKVSKEQARREAKAAKVKELMDYEYEAPKLKAIDGVPNGSKPIEASATDPTVTTPAADNEGTSATKSTQKRKDKRQSIHIQKQAEAQLVNDLALASTVPLPAETEAETAEPADTVVDLKPDVPTSKKEKKPKKSKQTDTPKVESAKEDDEVAVPSNVQKKGTRSASSGSAISVPAAKTTTSKAKKANKAKA